MVYSGYQDGLDVNPVIIETNIRKGIPRNTITGQADFSVKESMDRIRVALESGGFVFPLQNIVINLSPADLKKKGSQFDLPIAISILLATTQIESGFIDFKTVILGEIGLDSKIHPVKGFINLLIKLKEAGFKKFIVPHENCKEGSVVSGIDLFPISRLYDIKYSLKSNIPVTRAQDLQKIRVLPEISLYENQLVAFRALVVSVTGRHHMMLIGSPGSGKTKLIKLARLLQPDMDQEEVAELLRIESLKNSSISYSNIELQRPFRSPHHTSSEVSIVGGGNQIQMGEITMAHQGILFLDELGEFKPRVIQALREPMEEQRITISRANYRATYPASFLLLCATNPCPCGYHRDRAATCVCSSGKIKNYISRFNGPFLDRIEMMVELYGGENKNKKSISLNKIKEDIQQAIGRQRIRFAHNSSVKFNGNIKYYEDDLLDISHSSRKLIHSLQENMSLRRLFSLKKISRTIADLAHSEQIENIHVYEALQYCSSISESYFVKK